MQYKFILKCGINWLNFNWHLLKCDIKLQNEEKVFYCYWLSWKNSDIISSSNLNPSFYFLKIISLSFASFSSSSSGYSSSSTS